MAKCFAGIGARDTPAWAGHVMTLAGEKLGNMGWALQSGGAPGADRFFQDGAKKSTTPYRVYLPNAPFYGMPLRERGCLLPELAFPVAWQQALKDAAALHPNWPAVLAKGNDKLMARNHFQILGDDLQSPVKFVMCWSEKSTFDADGNIVDVSGGTGQAVRLAARHKIPVYNLNHRPHLEKICTWLGIDIPHDADLPVAKKPGRRP
jgi:hypothetical protein